MPEQKLLALCRRISVETDPKELTGAIDELIKLLAEEQDVIKAKISNMLSKSAGMPE